jgi:SAM-dependent methyltransferase
MTVRFDPRNALARPEIYEFFQDAIGNRRCRDRFVNHYVKPETGMRVLDIGCGPGSLIEAFPDVTYFGCDTDETYIAEAQDRYGYRGTFLAGLVENLGFEPNSFDRVVMSGVLHHLSEEVALRVLDTAADLLVPNGKLLAMEPCFVEGQNPIARFLISRDRGEFVRDADGYRLLCAKQFDVDVDIEHGMLRIPYTHALITGTLRH